MNSGTITGSAMVRIGPAEFGLNGRCSDQQREHLRQHAWRHLLRWSKQSTPPTTGGVPPAGLYHAVLNPSGTGNSVSDGVTFSPWSATPITGVDLNEKTPCFGCAPDDPGGYCIRSLLDRLGGDRLGYLVRCQGEQQHDLQLRAVRAGRRFAPVHYRDRTLSPFHSYYEDIEKNDVRIKERTAALAGSFSSEEQLKLTSRDQRHR